MGNAEAVRRHLVDVEGVALEKTSVIYNGLVPARRTRASREEVAAARERMGAPDGTFVVACVANFVPEKAHNVLLEAFARAKKSANDLFLVLVGKGHLEKDIRKARKQLEIEDSSCIVEDCLNPAGILCASHAAVLTSSIEGCSNAVLEAMAMALPLVVSNAGGNAELVDHGSGGFVCAVGDVDAFAQALVHLSRHKELGSEMGAYNARRVQQEFTDDILIDRTLALYRQVLDGGSLDLGKPFGRSLGEASGRGSLQPKFPF
jgi:glycosyltransferase involved in cell wall biosynthesis